MPRSVFCAAEIGEPRVRLAKGVVSAAGAEVVRSGLGSMVVEASLSKAKKTLNCFQVGASALSERLQDF